jgi:hypothetical protein
LLLEIALGYRDVTTGTDVQKTHTRSHQNDNDESMRFAAAAAPTVAASIAARTAVAAVAVALDHAGFVVDASGALSVGGSCT